MTKQDPTRRRFLQAGGYGMLAAAAASWPGAAHADEPARKIGFALVGLGRLTLGQLLPAFEHCKYSRIAALVSGHEDKAKKFAGQYGVNERSIYNYENFDRIKDNPDVDVVFVVLPNSMHAEYTIRAAKAGKHVLCEKPMANSVEECQQMIDACKAAGRKLMIGYRLRHEPYNIKAIEFCRARTYGALHVMDATHSFSIDPDTWRTDKKLAGGGPLVDIGIYCLNAARYLTGEEPTSVSAQTWQPKDDPRFKEVEATMAFSLKFPSGVLASCTTSYLHGYVGRFQLMTDLGSIVCDPSFAYGGLRMALKMGGAYTPIDLPQVNQFAAEIDHFSQCVLYDKPPVTPGEEGLADVKIIRKLYESAETGKTLDVS